MGRGRRAAILARAAAAAFAGRQDVHAQQIDHLAQDEAGGDAADDDQRDLAQEEDRQSHGGDECSGEDLVHGEHPFWQSVMCTF